MSEREVNRWTRIISEDKPEEKKPKPELILSDGKFEPYWVEALSDDDYHDDKTFVSSSNLKKVLLSKRTFYNDFFLAKKKDEKEKECFRLGKMFHMAILEGDKFKENFVLMPEFEALNGKGELTKNKNCKAVKEKYAAFRASLPSSAVICSESEREQIIGSVYSLLEHPQAAQIMKDSLTEVSGFFVDEESGLRCKIRPDILSKNCVILGDLKTTRMVDSMRFQNSVFDLGYYISMYMYTQGIKAISGVEPKIIPIIAMENTMPFECSIHYFKMENLRDYASREYRKALTDIRQAVDSGDWHQKQKHWEEIQPPAWWIYRQMKLEEKENNQP